MSVTIQGKVEFHRDSNGDAKYVEPTRGTWNLNGDPALMGLKTLCAAVSRDAFGCTLVWGEYYCDWCCGCKDEDHCSDQQCSIIAIPKVQAIAAHIEKLGGTPPSASSDIYTFLRALLTLVRRPRPALVT